ncbi:MAG: 1-acyl-sn-glycerol-3-phosphate acyltransferase [bacterium]|nr:1-acyl-sn-glycerol-3-phosphate acyltransferase [bacterium]MCY3652937.1 1-acyl-sn-glycerol-3-phosphate acyltransferase [bacterium]MXX65376.1 hypothetical protein [Acidimicrobiia bacterium]
MKDRSDLTDLLTDQTFQADLAKIASQTDRTIEQANRAARNHLREMAGDISPRVAGFTGRLAWWICRRNYRTIRFNPEGLTRLEGLEGKYPVIFLPSHKSQLDHAVLHHLMWKNGRAPNYTASGINLNFFPLGSLVRRSGSFFIRRQIGNRPVYKLVLNAYLSHLLEQSYPVEWYIEGTRSRTGRLLPPSFGLLSYAVQALRNQHCDDIYLVPTSIVYDLVEEIDPYVSEQLGKPKRKETLVWLFKTILRFGRRYGDIHVRFGPPLSIVDRFAADSEVDRRNQVEALGTEVCSLINAVTPVTATAWVVATLLGLPNGSALSLPKLAERMAELVQDAERRGVPMVDNLAEQIHPTNLETVLSRLSRQKLVEVDRSRGWRITPNRRLAASYYRNAIAHHYVIPAAAEIALALTGKASREERLETFNQGLKTIHSLFQTDFFLPESSVFYKQIQKELTDRIPDWEPRLLNGASTRLLQELFPHRAPWALRHFVEAYWVAGQTLAEPPSTTESDPTVLLWAALDKSHAYVKQGRISAEAASLPLLSLGLTRPRNQSDQLGAILEAIRSLQQESPPPEP